MNEAAIHAEAPDARPHSQALSLLLIVLIAVKLIIFALDPAPLLFMGDSATHIETARRGYVPRERSYTYGLLVRALAVWPGTMATLVLAQVLASAMTAWLLALALVRFFSVRPAVAFAAAFCCCLDPLLIVHERFVLTETFAQTLFAAHVVCALWYLHRVDLVPLCIASLTGLFLLSFRTVYVPLILFNALFLPFLAVFRMPQVLPLANRAKRCALHLGFSFLITTLLHAGYREWLGQMINTSPAYLPDGGLFLITAWAPIISPEDHVDPRTEQVIKEFTEEHFPLKDPSLYDFHRWNKDGLVHHLCRAFHGNYDATNQAAHQTAMNALRRDPKAVAWMGVQRYLKYLRILHDPRYQLLGEQGAGTLLTESFLQDMKSTFDWNDATIPSSMTPAKHYHLAGTPWYFLLLHFPLVGLVSLISCRSPARAGALLVFLNGTLQLIVILVLATPCIRFLCPLSFCVLIALGIIAERALGIIETLLAPTIRGTCLTHLR
jgi:hypothetical protein